MWARKKDRYRTTAVTVLIARVVLVFGLMIQSITASEIVYTPVNPSFGGNPVNGGFLLGLANAQRQFEREQDENTPLEEFNERLQRSLLSRITSAVTRDIVDVDGNITPGNFETTEFLIEIIDEGEGLITIITTDRETGEQSIIQVNNDITEQ